ncbi:MAG: WHG domain-containing protein [Anaerolineales bacterium]|nr:WHG domain-containing protein [Anaerolineales bacterium]
MAKTRQLTPEVVIETAARLANELRDASRITLTDLAAELNIRVPSLYNHVKGLDGLRRDLTVWGLQQLLAATRQAVLGQVGRDALLAVAHAYRAFAHAQPGVYSLVLKAPPPEDAQLTALSNELLLILQLVLASYNLQGEAALHAIRGFRSVLHGFVSLETGGAFELLLDRDESFNRLVEIYLDGLSKN